MRRTLTVSRHDFPAGDAEGRASRLDKSARRRIDTLERLPENLNLAFGTSLLAAKTHCGSDVRAALLPTWEAWGTAMAASKAPGHFSADVVVAGQPRHAGPRRE